MARLRNPTIAEINQLIEDETRRGKILSTRPPQEYHKLWFTISETCEDPVTLPPLQTRIYDEILKFQQMDRIDPLNNQTDKEKFPWQDSVLQAEKRELVAELLLEFHIFAMHRFDVGYNTELKS